MNDYDRGGQQKGQVIGKVMDLREAVAARKRIEAQQKEAQAQLALRFLMERTTGPITRRQIEQAFQWAAMFIEYANRD